VVVFVAARAFAGDVTAPLIVLLVATMPIVALLRAHDARPSSAPHVVLALPGVACVFAAHAVVIADFARLDGLPRAIAPILVLMLACAPLARAANRRASVWVASIGVTAIALSVAIVGIAAGVAPWTAWNRAASRPALVFADESEWVTDGGTLAAPTTLAFTESHRVTAVTASVWRIVENDGAKPTSRERRVAARETVVMRPGDVVSLEAGARIRFERGKRVPSVAASGIAWADPKPRRGAGAMLAALGVIVTIAGAAFVLVAPARALGTLDAFGAAVMPTLLALVAASAGIDAMYVAPDIALHAIPAAALHDLPSATIGGIAATPIVVTIGLALLTMFLATTDALADRVREIVVPFVGGHGVFAARATWILFAVLASAAALLVADGARLLVLGFGLLATTWTAPALAGAPSRASVIGAIAGAVVFAICTAAEQLAGLQALAAYPALVAAPVAWATAAALGRWWSREAAASTVPAVAGMRSR
jgi:hypothetical protein